MEKPFIKLVHSPNSGYFYDVGKNEIIRIPERLYSHLVNVMEGTSLLEQPYDEKTMQMIESFKTLGYLSSRKPKMIRHSATGITPLLLERCIDKITLQLTQDCNFRCKYCIYSEDKNFKQRTHSHKTMSLDTAKRAILFYRDHAVDSKFYDIGFYGGEPLLEWNLLEEIVIFAEKELAGKLISFSLTTNASMLTASKAAFLEEHNVSVLVSLDGIKEINDKNRVFRNGRGTTDVVLENLQAIRMNHPKLFNKLRISTVIDPTIDVSLLGKYPDVLKSLPLDHYSVSLEDNTDHNVLVSPELRAEMNQEIILAFLSEFGLYSGVVKPYGYNQVQSIRRPYQFKPANGINETMAPGGPCIPGKSRLLVSVNGDLYPCERINEVESNCIGNLQHGFDVEKAKRILNVGVITESKCRDCWALRQCSICIKSFDYSHPNAFVEKAKLCSSIQESAFEKLRWMILLYELENFYQGVMKTGERQ